ncbi:TetR/AcrR family transcriptional regulator C-terminal domain-containing protein [Ruania alkalisoli]|uniref:TetR/AcrR family transcriptional regulator C-terminal domain-containing protein n=1 Tax=Ruania alkalisoli TaxID=2779775 RepID=A0A7M1SUW6_9MICO|nr:TetR/AcrR family transcriptional regulator [Ruania alkalisoli]QOR71376.1 TetR/AcrR family transcriptional regulator C-terminal domain-containing protein [Ruania alkalisoli]
MATTTSESHESEAHAQLVRALELLWHGHTPTGRGPKPGLTVEAIVDAAIDVADADGVEALSMRRIARELGVGTMSLYRYVPDKNVLLALVLDRVLAPTGEAPQPPLTWRDTLESNARSARALYLRHRWLLQVNMTRPALGPGTVAGLERTMAGLVDLPLSDKERMNVVVALEGFVTGAVREQIFYEQIAEESGLDDEAFWGAQLPFMEVAMTSGTYPTMASLSSDTFEGTWEETFDLGLTCFLDGLERRVGRG